ncbi:MAG: glycosyltransferase [Thermodesulfobacteriota bacterium]|nr:glycosyltransferase [Thermodesulfobacteriota bacterium]
MRVLHVYKTYFPDTQGGLEEAIRQICDNTRQQGVESRIFCLSPNPHPQRIHRPEADVYRASLTMEIASCGFSFQSLSIFRQLVDWADIVQYHFPWPFADMLHLLARVTKPTIIAYQSDIVRQQGLLKLYQPLMHYFLSSANCIVATSPNYVETSDILRGYTDKIEIIPIGLNQQSYPEPVQKTLQQVRFSVGDGYFLFIGVLRYYKGLHVLLQAAQNGEFKIVIAGSGPEQNNLKQQARQLGLNNVQFLGFVDDETKVALIKNARAIVFPSNQRSEAYGVTLIEGAMFSKPLITVEIGSGMSYINIDAVTGLSVEPNNPLLLRAAMEKLYHNPTLAQQYGQQAHQRYQQLFTGKRMGELYAQLYAQLQKKG